MMYQNPNLYYPYGMPFNSSYVVPSAMTTSPSTVPVYSNHLLILPMNQPSESAPHVTYPTSPYAMSLTQQPITPSLGTLSNQQPSITSSNPKKDNPPQSENPQPILYSLSTSQNYR